ncbi:hypothetical protein PED39_03940 [Methanomassiliicoccales archaeon LGM-RCC1]|nr:hypothetical protein PED39_03940 [Methanomassiliicoccales archaeon LGM-RCC1]
MTEQIDNAGKLRKISPFAVTVAAVVLVLFASFIVYDGGQKEMDLDGNWHLASYAEGYYDDDGSTVYETYDPKYLWDEVATFEEIGDGIYSMHLDGSEYICVANGNTMMTGGIWDFTNTSILTKIEDTIIVSSFLDGYIGVARMIFERQDPGDRLVAGSREASWGDSYEFQEGDVYEAFIANQYTEDGIIDHLSENRYLTINGVKPGIMFYNSHGDQTDLDFVAVKVSPNDWMAISDYDSDTCLIDMVHIEDGVIYTASYDNTNGDIELWQVCYGDESKVVKAPSTLWGKRYEGTFNAYVEENGVVLRSMEDEVAITFDLVDSNTNVIEVTLFAPEGDSYFGAMLFPNESGYSFYMESVYDNNGETFWGYYFGTISKDLKKITIVGTADNAAGTYMIFNNVFKLAE